MKLRTLGLIVTLAPGILMGPLAPDAQQAGKVHRIGVLSETSPLPTGRHEGWVNAFRELGYIEGQNIAFEFRWAAEKYDLLPGLAAELVRLKVDVIVTGSTPAALVAQQVTSALPIITLSADPIGAGLVTSLGRPGPFSLISTIPSSSVTRWDLSRGMPWRRSSTANALGERRPRGSAPLPQCPRPRGTPKTGRLSSGN